MAHRTVEQDVGRLRATDEIAFGVQLDGFLVDLAIADQEARGRQRVDHLVGEHHAFPGLVERAVDPVHARGQLGRQVLLQTLLLALAQIGTGFEDGVARRQRIQLGQAQQHGLGEGAGAAAQLQHPRLRAELGEHRCQRIGHAAGKQAAKLGRGGEVTAATELAGAGAVIAPARGVQAQLHEAREGMAPPCARISARRAAASWSLWARASASGRGRWAAWRVRMR